MENSQNWKTNEIIEVMHKGSWAWGLSGVYRWLPYQRKIDPQLLEYILLGALDSQAIMLVFKYLDISNPETATRIVRARSGVLSYLPDVMRDNEGVVGAAISKYPCELGAASPRLQQKEEWRKRFEGSGCFWWKPASEGEGK